mgnify:CR=1 FL=1
MVYVAYESYEHGHSEIYVRVGETLKDGTKWKQTKRITNSSKDSVNPDIAVFGDDLVIACETNCDCGESIKLYKVSLGSFGYEDVIEYTVVEETTFGAKFPCLAVTENYLWLSCNKGNELNDNVQVSVFKTDLVGSDPEFNEHIFELDGISEKTCLYAFSDKSDKKCLALAWSWPRVVAIKP